MSVACIGLRDQIDILPDILYVKRVVPFARRRSTANNNITTYDNKQSLSLRTDGHVGNHFDRSQMNRA